MSQTALPDSGTAEKAGYVIRTATRAEVDMAVEWAAREGWNPGLHDADCFYAQDPEGFLVAELNGEVVGSASGVRYEGGFGFAGFYIMRPEFRGHHIGYELGCAAVNRLADVNAGLDGVLKQQPKYRKLWGFELAHRNVRYELSSGASAASAAAAENSTTAAQSADGAARAHVQIVPLSDVPFDKFAAYDLQMFRFPRETFLRCWISRPGTVALGAARDGELVGYGVIRPCRKGFKLAPLFADSPGIADALFRELAQHAGSEPVYLDIPQVNPAALDLVQRHGMSAVFETARMYTKGDPGLPLERIYGITSFELG